MLLIELHYRTAISSVESLSNHLTSAAVYLYYCLSLMTLPRGVFTRTSRADEQLMSPAITNDGELLLGRLM